MKNEMKVGMVARDRDAHTQEAEAGHWSRGLGCPKSQGSSGIAWGLV